MPASLLAEAKFILAEAACHSSRLDPGRVGCYRRHGASSPAAKRLPLLSPLLGADVLAGDSLIAGLGVGHEPERSVGPASLSVGSACSGWGLGVSSGSGRSA
jgi:hypothetical protein